MVNIKYSKLPSTRFSYLFYEKILPTVIDVLQNLNEAVKKNSRSHMMEALKQISLKLQKTTSPEDASLYLKLFKKCLAEKHSDGSELWLEDVEQITQVVVSEAESAQLGALNSFTSFFCSLFFKHEDSRSENFPFSVHYIVSNKHGSGAKRSDIHARLSAIGKIGHIR